MSRRLFWKFCASFGLTAVVLVYLVGISSTWVEHQMSLLAAADRAEMRRWGQQAEQLLVAGDRQVLQQWLDQLQQREQTLVAVVRVEEQWLTSGLEEERQLSRIGRSLDWAIHLHHTGRPIMQVPFSDGIHSLAVRLPERMLPGQWWPWTSRALQILPPLLLMLLLSALFYRHLMRPLRQLQLATRRFNAGDYDVRAGASLGRRQDELAELAHTFDGMADHIGGLIRTQRHLIRDLSHELRTPLTRLELALDDQLDDNQLRQRGRKEAAVMRQLVEDTLMLAALERGDTGQMPESESVDLTLLLEAISEDARYEFQDRQLRLQLSEQHILPQGNERALSQALENIIRNALRHTPPGTEVVITEKQIFTDKPTAEQMLSAGCLLQIRDNGPGVPEEHLDDIFQPFFRIDRARSRAAGGSGLGLALARRQLESQGGTVQAFNHPEGGLVMVVWLPVTDVMADITPSGSVKNEGVVKNVSTVKNVSSVKDVKNIPLATGLNEN
ncbi:MAG: sensor histidine kinase [Marinobacterium sp.]|nr:sensor histidine kinase [Marinobacterium sp.]